MLREKYKSDECGPELTNFLNNALGCVVSSHSEDPIMNPSNIKDTVHSLQIIVRKKGKLSHN